MLVVNDDFTIGGPPGQNIINSKFEYTMLKGTESVTQTTYEEYDEKFNISSKNRTSNK